MRGLQQKSETVDTDYIFLNEGISRGIFIFQGISGLTNIVLNQTWDLISLRAKNISKIGFLNNSAIFPLGAHSWYINTDLNDLENGSNETCWTKTELKLTKVIFDWRP